MEADSTKTTSATARRPKKDRNRGINGNRDVMIGDTSPIWTEPKTSMAARKVPVLYYLTRNGHLQHPHLIDVPFSSPHGLYLRDVLNTLNYRRGKGMANLYSWSFKRSYKNGYVWHDLSENDLIQVTDGQDYILKGSELPPTHVCQNPTETIDTGDDCSSTKMTAAAAAMIRGRNQSWSSFDNPQEHMVVKCESNRELAANFAADAATQTKEQRRRRSLERKRKEHVTIGLSREDMPSPPPSNSSSEGVSGPRYVDQKVNVRDRDPTAENQHDGSGRMKASQVLIQLITCGAPSRLKVQAR